MRVVILYNTSWYVFLLRRTLISSLLRAGHQVTVVAPHDPYTERVQQLGASFVPIKMSGTGRSPLEELGTLRDIYQALRSIKPDAVFSFTAKCNLYAGFCRARLSFRFIPNVSGLGEIFDRDAIFNKMVHRLFKASFARADRVFFQNKEDRELLLSRGIVSATRSIVIPGSGVDLNHFTPSSRHYKDVRSFLMLGRLLPKKGFDRFLDAAIELRRRFGSQVAFWILGTPDFERSESISLFERIQEAHASGTIRYLQSTDDVRPYLQEADVIVLPSTYNEGVPRSLLEALACGKPIITTDWKGCRETVEHNHNGLLVTPHSTPALITALTKMIEASHDELSAMGQRSRTLAEKRFNEKIVLDAYHAALLDNGSDEAAASSSHLMSAFPRDNPNEANRSAA